MAKLLPKVILDEALLAELTKYYKVNTSSDSWDADEFLGWECFSHPSLEYHDCNIRAKLLGGHACAYCKHVPGRPCNISCDFQHFCLSAFAFRLGIGGDDLKAAMHNNLYVLKNKDLYFEVIKKFSDEEIEEAGLTETAVEAPNALQLEDMEEVEEEVEEPKDPWLTIKEAADHYGCTYSNIYNYVNKGKLNHIVRGGGRQKKVLIKQSVVDKFKSRPEKRKSFKRG